MSIVIPSQVMIGKQQAAVGSYDATSFVGPDPPTSPTSETKEMPRPDLLVFVRSAGLDLARISGWNPLDCRNFRVISGVLKCISCSRTCSLTICKALYLGLSQILIKYWYANMHHYNISWLNNVFGWVVPSPLACWRWYRHSWVLLSC